MRGPGAGDTTHPGKPAPTHEASSANSFLDIESFVVSPIMLQRSPTFILNPGGTAPSGHLATSGHICHWNWKRWCHWLLVARGQGCCQPLHNAQDSPYHRELSSPRCQQGQCCDTLLHSDTENQWPLPLTSPEVQRSPSIPTAHETLTGTFSFSESPKPAPVASPRTLTHHCGDQGEGSRSSKRGNLLSKSSVYKEGAVNRMHFPNLNNVLGSAAEVQKWAISRWINMALVVQIKLHSWTSKLKFHIVFKGQKLLLLRFFEKHLKMWKRFLAIQTQAAGLKFVDPWNRKLNFIKHRHLA